MMVFVLGVGGGLGWLGHLARLARVQHNAVLAIGKGAEAFTIVGGMKTAISVRMQSRGD